MCAARQKIAIVGGGGGGLGCAYVLSRVADVTVYEAEAQLGGHAHTVDFPCADGKRRPVDMGIILTDPWTYPVLYAILRKYEIDLATRAVGWTLGASFGPDEFWYTGGPRTPLWKRVEADASRLDLEIARLTPDDMGKPVRQWLAEIGCSEEFAAKALAPALTLLVVTRAGLLGSPVANLQGLFSDKQISFYHATSWRLFTQGTRSYVNALVGDTPADFRIRTPIAKGGVARTDGKVHITDGAGKTTIFDQVVFATQANLTLELLSDPSPEERALLGQFTFQKAELYLHSDDSVLSPHLPRDLGSQYCFEGGVPQTDLEGSFTLNLGVGLNLPPEAGPVLVTGYNPESPMKRPDPKKTVESRLWEHEIATLEQFGARSDFHSIQGSNLTWHCGTSTVWPSADAVLTSGMVLATKIAPEAVFPFHDTGPFGGPGPCSANFQQIEQVMFPKSAQSPDPTLGVSPKSVGAARYRRIT